MNIKKLAIACPFWNWDPEKNPAFDTEEKDAYIIISNDTRFMIPSGKECYTVWIVRPFSPTLWCSPDRRVKRLNELHSLDDANFYVESLLSDNFEFLKKKCLTETVETL